MWMIPRYMRSWRHPLLPLHGPPRSGCHRRLVDRFHVGMWCLGENIRGFLGVSGDLTSCTSGLALLKNFLAGGGARAEDAGKGGAEGRTAALATVTRGAMSLELKYFKVKIPEFF